MTCKNRIKQLNEPQNTPTYEEVYKNILDVIEVTCKFTSLGLILIFISFLIYHYIGYKIDILDTIARYIVIIGSIITIFLSCIIIRPKIKFL